jgi:hypothetical protein
MCTPYVSEFSLYAVERACNSACACYGQVIIKTDNMDIAGELVTDLATFVGIMDVSSVADFPLIMQSFKVVLTRASDAAWRCMLQPALQPALTLACTLAAAWHRWRSTTARASS